jgi:hypothetical protein
MRKALLNVFLVSLACFSVAFAATDSGAPAGEPGEPVPPVDTGDGSLTTLFAQNNNFGANSFDLTPNVDMTVVGWDVNLDTVVDPWTVQVWYRAGTANGNEQSGGWTMLGQIQVSSNGIDQPTHVDIGGLDLTAGETTGVIIGVLEGVTGTGGFMYTNGTGADIFSNADLTVQCYAGMNEVPPPHTSYFTPRVWNGTVHYSFGGVGVDEQSWGSIKVGYR